MPSSPGPNDYKRTLQRFFYRGISLTPQDALPESKYSFISNMRSYEEGTVEPRYGQIPVNADPIAGEIRSLWRLNDSTSFATAVPAQRFVGADDTLYSGTPGTDVY